MALAALAAMALAAAPTIVGRSGAAGDPAGLSRAEGGMVSKRPYVHGETPAGRRAQSRRLARCERPAFRARNWALCPSSAGPRPRGGGMRANEVAGPAESGAWSALTPVPSLAIHAVTLATGRVLWFTREPGHQGASSHLYDPATGRTTEVPIPTVTYPDGERLPANIWCAGQVQLPDGRILVAGGNLSYPYGDGDPTEGRGFRGAPWVFLFDPWNSTWERLRRADGTPWDMAKGRWYPTLLPLSDGRVVILGGWDGSGYQGNVSEVEVFTPRATPGGRDTLETVGSLPGDRPWVNIYPHMFLLPKATLAGRGETDKVLVAGPGTGDAFVLDTGDWSWRALATGPGRSRFWGTAVMEPGGPDGPTRISLIGGSDVEANPSAPARTATTEYLDLNDPGFAEERPAPSWQPGPSLVNPRSHLNTVLLPDGGKLTTGGGRGQAPDGSLYADPVYVAELFDPVTGQWREVAKEDDARTYHSTAVLMPDGRVLSAGDDRIEHVGPPVGLGQPTAQVYSPPYLFRGARPRVDFAPPAVAYATPFTITASGPEVDRVVLMRPGAVTHATDMDQRLVALELAREGGRLRVTSPPDPSVAPPGYYMLFVLDAAGVPSEARWIRLDPGAPAPAEPPAAPAVAAPGASPGAAQPPAGWPVAPAVLPDRTAPGVLVRAQRVRVRGRVAIVTARVTVGERAVVRARLRGAPGRRGARVAAAPLRRLRLAPARPARVIVRARLRPARGVRVARLLVTATDAAGNRSVARVAVRVRQRR